MGAKPQDLLILYFSITFFTLIFVFRNSYRL